MKKNMGSFKPRSLVGMGLIVFAVLLLFNNMGFKFLALLLNYWTIVLIFVGAILLYGSRNVKQPKTIALPYFLMGIGIVFTLSKYNFFSFSIGALIAPIILLIVGFYILRPINNNGDYQRFLNITDSSGSHNNERLLPGEETKIEIATILAGGNYSTRSQNIATGSAVCILGGADIDISEADSKNALIEIEVVAIIGGARFKVPPHWQVTVKAIPLLGGISNKTTCLAEKLGLPKKHLVISGIALMGGIEITN